MWKITKQQKKTGYMWFSCLSCLTNKSRCSIPYQTKSARRRHALWDACDGYKFVITSVFGTMFSDLRRWHLLDCQVRRHLRVRILQEIEDPLL